MKTSLGSGVVSVLAIVAVMAIAACDTTKNQNSSLSVTSSPTGPLTGAGATATLTLSSVDTNVTLNLPLVWTVSDPNLGGIKSSAGISAVYESRGLAGNNVVTVRDQGEAEGLIVINQE